MSSKRRLRGMSLIEVVVLIVVLGIGIAGVVTLYGQLTKASVDPLVRKQALAIATSLMEEIQLKGFTYCDPDDPNVYTATGAGILPGQCATAPEVIGPNEPTANAETRYGPTRFDNVNDYNGFKMPATVPDPLHCVLNRICDVTGADISGLDAYAVSVTVEEASGDFPAVPASNAVLVNEALRITVLVKGPAGVNVSLQGYRLRYAPNTP